MTLPELLAVIAIIAIGTTMAVVYLDPTPPPLDAAGERLEAVLRQAQSRAVATTTSHRVRAADSTTLVVEAGRSCPSASGWSEAPRLGGELEHGATFASAGWDVCFNARGTSDAGVTIAITHPDDGTRSLEILRGGAMRWLP